MSTLGDIEDAFVSKVQAITYGADPAFMTVRGYIISRSDVFPKVILSERMPAAYVGFRSTFFDSDFFSLVRFFSVYVASQNLRRQHDARHDFGSSPGLFTLIQQVNDELDGASIGSSLSLLAGISTMSADPKTIVTRLSYSVYADFASASITVDGNALLDAGSAANLIVGSPEVRTADFAFPGTNGVIRQLLGTGPREVTIRGLLRTADDAAMNSKEAELESFAGDGSTHTISDSTGRTLGDCVGKSYERRGVRTQRWGSLPVSQRFVLRYEQLAY